MKTAIFSTKEYDRHFFDAANKGHRHELTYHTESLHRTTAGMADGFAAVCAFVNDQLDSSTLSALAAGGTRLGGGIEPALQLTLGCRGVPAQHGGAPGA